MNISGSELFTDLLFRDDCSRESRDKTAVDAHLEFS